TFWHIQAEMSRFPEVRIEIVPGVPSTSAAAARAALPIARLDERVAILPAAYGLERLPELLDTFATVFLLKVHDVIDELLRVLTSVRARIKAVYLEKVGTPEERIVTDLEALRGRDIPYFSLIMLRREDGA